MRAAEQLSSTTIRWRPPRTSRVQGTLNDIAETTEQRTKKRRAIQEQPAMATHQAAEDIERSQWTRQRQEAMRAIIRLLNPELQVCILHGTLLWPGGQVSSPQAARAVGTFSRSPYKDAWSQVDPQKYGFQTFSELWKHLVDEYLVHATPSLGFWMIRRHGTSIFVKLTPAALQACPARMKSLQEIGICMENYFEKYHARLTYSHGVRDVQYHGELFGEVQSDPNGRQVHESHVLRSRGLYVWCQQCGAYYSTAYPVIYQLKGECQDPSRYGRANLKRIREGRPPCNLASKLAKRLGTLSPGHALAPSPA